MTKITGSSASIVGDRRDVSRKPSTPVSLPNDPLKIGLASWIIQDGNYGDFDAGMRSQFALEFFSKNLTSLEEHAVRKSSIKHIEDDQYRVVGTIAHAKPDWIGLDFGFLAYQCSVRSEDYKVGAWYRGDISLGVDHYLYFEKLSNQTDAPPMIYTWSIDSIELLTAPWVEEPSGLKKRDTRNWGWKRVKKTDAWKDDNGNTEYLFSCSRLSTAARLRFDR